MRRLLIHEARVHAVPDRTLEDLGDGLLLTDPDEPEPFWNRLECVRWPADPSAFDRRLTEMLVRFAGLGRRAHIWASPLHDSPTDLVARLFANGFRDMGSGNLMLLVDPGPADRASASPLASGLTIERLSRLTGPVARQAAADVVRVLLDAFEVDPGRSPSLAQETEVSLSHPWFTHYLARIDGVPAAVVRRATFDQASYLSSIGTASWARGRGLGGLVTRIASHDAIRAGSRWTHLGVFEENLVAIHVYERSGFERIGTPAPDLVLI